MTIAPEVSLSGLINAMVGDFIKLVECESSDMDSGFYNSTIMSFSMDLSLIPGETELSEYI